MACMSTTVTEGVVYTVYTVHWESLSVRLSVCLSILETVLRYSVSVCLAILWDMAIYFKTLHFWVSLKIPRFDVMYQGFPKSTTYVLCCEFYLPVVCIHCTMVQRGCWHSNYDIVCFRDCWIENKNKWDWPIRLSPINSQKVSHLSATLSLSMMLYKYTQHQWLGSCLLDWLLDWLYNIYPNVNYYSP